MKWLIFFLLALIIPAQAIAQPKQVVATCGSVTFVVGDGVNGTVDPNGKECVNATVSASVAVAPLTSTNLSSTIAVTNTFQSIQVSTAGRNGCAIQNNDTNTMWVFFGAIGGATKAKSVALAAGQSVACAVGGIGVLTDQISITGAATGVFFAAVQ